MSDVLKQAPFSLDAEQAVLGGLMLDERALTRVSDFLSEDDFYRADHRLIFKAISELGSQGKPYDTVTLAEWFDANGVGDVIDGNYILKLANTTPSAANVAAYGEIVRERSRLRQIIDVGTNLASEAYKPKADASLIASAAQNTLGALVGDPRGGGLVSSKSRMGAWWADLQKRYEQEQRMTGLVTPWTDLNEVTLGLQPGDLIIVAARPSMGKTVFGCELASHTALKGGHVAMFSLEMRHEAILQRMIASLARVDHKHLRAPVELMDEEWPRVADATTKLGAAPLYIDDQRSLTATQIVARAKRQHLRHPLSLVVIDHMHEVRMPGRDRVNELGDAARAFKDLGYQCKVPIVLLVQLNRGLMQRADHRPTLGDLRGSGSFEEIADIVLLLHREEMHDHNTHLKNVLELILGKGRDLPAGDTIYLETSYRQMKLQNWQGDLPERPTKTRAKKSGNGLSAPAYQESAEK